MKLRSFIKETSALAAGFSVMRRFRLLTIAILVLVVLAWTMKGRHKAQPAQTEKREALPPTTAPSLDSPPRQASPIQENLLSTGPMPIDHSKFAEFLAANPNSPSAWAAVVDLTGSEEVLLEALSKFPDDKKLLSCAMLTMKSDADRATYGKKFMQLFPDSSLGPYAMAKVAFNSGGKDAGLEWLKLAMSKKPPVLLTDNDILNRQAALKSGGYIGMEFAVRLFTTPGEMDGGHGLHGLVKNIGENANNNDSMGEVLLGYSVQMGQTGSKSAYTELAAHGFERSALQYLPADAEYGDTGKTVGERLSEVRGEVASLSETMERLPSLWATATPEEIKEWTDAALAGGEIFAYKRWIENRDRK